MKVSELTNDQLDYWVAKAQGWNLDEALDAQEDGLVWYDDTYSYKAYRDEYTPSTNWQQCGELIEKYRLYLNPSPHGWIAIARGKHYGADTPQRAVCMAVIASVYGDEV